YRALGRGARPSRRTGRDVRPWRNILDATADLRYGQKTSVIAADRLVFDRHPGVTILLGADMANAGKRQMRAGDPQLLLGRVGEDLPPGGHGLPLVHVELDGDFGMHELRRVAM